MTEDQRDPLRSIHDAIIYDYESWSETSRMAWVYGIVVGWNSETLKEIAKDYDWDATKIASLKRLHEEFRDIAKLVSDGLELKAEVITAYYGSLDVPPFGSINAVEAVKELAADRIRLRSLEQERRALRRVG